MNRLWWGVLGCGLTGCAALESATRNTTDFIFGTPSGQDVVNTVTGVAAGLPPPWNIVISAVVSAVAGVGLWNYRRRLLKADPTKID